MGKRTRRKHAGKRVPARIQSYCVNCHEERLCWLWAVSTSSPRSYMGVRIRPQYVCSTCGEIVHE